MQDLAVDVESDWYEKAQNVAGLQDLGFAGKEECHAEDDLAAEPLVRDLQLAEHCSTSIELAKLFEVASAGA